MKKTLEKLKNEEFCGYHLEKSGGTWITWKDREHIVPKMDDTCGHLLKE